MNCDLCGKPLTAEVLSVQKVIVHNGLSLTLNVCLEHMSGCSEHSTEKTQ